MVSLAIFSPCNIKASLEYFLIHMKCFGCISRIEQALCYLGNLFVEPFLDPDKSINNSLRHTCQNHSRTEKPSVKRLSAADRKSRPKLIGQRERLSVAHDT
jgi:hypothetical protein